MIRTDAPFSLSTEEFFRQYGCLWLVNLVSARTIAIIIAINSAT